MVRVYRVVAYFEKSDIKKQVVTSEMIKSMKLCSTFKKEEELSKIVFQ
ncbi:hypothetical protein ACWG0P_12095 [Amedibacillus sp. YH-ame6]